VAAEVMVSTGQVGRQKKNEEREHRGGKGPAQLPDRRRPAVTSNATLRAR